MSVIGINKIALMKKDGRAVLLFKATLPFMKDEDGADKFNSYYKYIYGCTLDAARDLAEKSSGESRTLAVLTLDYSISNDVRERVRRKGGKRKVRERLAVTRVHTLRSPGGDELSSKYTDTFDTASGRIIK